MIKHFCLVFTILILCSAYADNDSLLTPTAMPETISDLSYQEKINTISSGWQNPAVKKYNSEAELNVETDAEKLARQKNETEELTDKAKAEREYLKDTDFEGAFKQKYRHDYDLAKEQERLERERTEAEIEAIKKASQKKILSHASVETTPSLTEDNKPDVSIASVQVPVSFPIDNKKYSDKKVSAGSKKSTDKFKTIGTVNGRKLIDANSLLTAKERSDFKSVIQAFGIKARGCDAAGCGNIDAKRVANGPAEHEGTDLLRRAGQPIPTMFDGTIKNVDNKYDGLKGLSILNDNGTTTYLGYVELRGFKVGDKVKAGDVVAVSQSLKMHPDYAMVPNHVHYELWTGGWRGSGDLVSVESLLK